MTNPSIQSARPEGLSSRVPWQVKGFALLLCMGLAHEPIRVLVQRAAARPVDQQYHAAFGFGVFEAMVLAAVGILAAWLLVVSFAVTFGIGRSPVIFVAFALKCWFAMPNFISAPAPLNGLFMRGCTMIRDSIWTPCGQAFLADGFVTWAVTSGAGFATLLVAWVWGRSVR